ncbi:hypothetical protein JCM10207_009249 [Rhodosporidiobolus poonsookiae]
MTAYIPSHAPPPTLFTPTTVYSLAATVALLIVAQQAARALLPPATYSHTRKRITWIWLAYDALIHFILEGSFIFYSFPRPRTVNTGSGPLAALWREYALADTRWGVSDSGIVAVELLTVFGAGPCALWCCELMRRGDGAASYWIVVLSVAELYGGWMTFAPEWLTSSPSLNTSHWLYTYVYLLFFNGLWVVVPLWLLWEAYGEIVGAVRAQAVLKEGKRA